MPKATDHLRSTPNLAISIHLAKTRSSDALDVENREQTGKAATWRARADKRLHCMLRRPQECHRLQIGMHVAEKNDRERRTQACMCREAENCYIGLFGRGASAHASIDDERRRDPLNRFEGSSDQAEEEKIPTRVKACPKCELASGAQVFVHKQTRRPKRHMANFVGPHAFRASAAPASAYGKRHGRGPSSYAPTAS